MKMKTLFAIMMALFYARLCVAQTNKISVSPIILQSISVREAKILGIERQMRENDKKLKELSEKLTLEMDLGKPNPATKRDMAALSDKNSVLHKDATKLRLEVMEINSRYKLPASKKK